MDLKLVELNQAVDHRFQSLCRWDKKTHSAEYYVEKNNQNNTLQQHINITFFLVLAASIRDSSSEKTAINKEIKEKKEKSLSKSIWKNDQWTLIASFVAIGSKSFRYTTQPLLPAL